MFWNVFAHFTVMKPLHLIWSLPRNAITLTTRGPIGSITMCIQESGGGQHRCVSTYEKLTMHAERLPRTNLRNTSLVRPSFPLSYLPIKLRLRYSVEKLRTLFTSLLVISLRSFGESPPSTPRSCSPTYLPHAWSMSQIRLPNGA